MISEPRPEFWVLYHRLPVGAKTAARKSYVLIRMACYADSSFLVSCDVAEANAGQAKA